MSWVHIADAARVLISEADDRLAAAVGTLRDAGADESAEALTVERRRLEIWTQDGGFLDCMAADD